MKRILIVITCSWICCFCFAQTGVLIGDTIAIYKKHNDTQPFFVLQKTAVSDGLPLHVMGEDNLDFSYYIEGRIIKMRKKMSFVQFNPVGKCPQDIYQLKSGWIRNEHLGVGVNFHPNLCLYDKPTYQAPSHTQILSPSTYIGQIIGTHNSWLKISLIIDGTTIQGWLPKNSQCTNMFSICMGN